MITIDALARRYVAPVLKAAGFRRKRREVQQLMPSGIVIVLGIYPQGTDESGLHQFVLQYGAVSPLMLEYRESKVGESSSWLGTSDALIFTALQHPLPLDPTAGLDQFPYRWTVPTRPSEAEAVGASLVAKLEDEVLIRLKKWASYDGLADAVLADERGNFYGMIPVRAAAIALLGALRLPELDVLLSRFDSDDPVRIWINSKTKPA